MKWKHIRWATSSESIQTRNRWNLSTARSVAVVLSIEKYDIALTLMLNFDNSLILTETQYKFLREFEPKIKNWVDILRTVET